MYILGAAIQIKLHIALTWTFFDVDDYFIRGREWLGTASRIWVGRSVDGCGRLFFLAL